MAATNKKSGIKRDQIKLRLVPAEAQMLRTDAERAKKKIQGVLEEAWQIWRKVQQMPIEERIALGLVPSPKEKNGEQDAEEDGDEQELDKIIESLTDYEEELLLAAAGAIKSIDPRDFFSEGIRSLLEAAAKYQKEEQKNTK